MGTLAVSTFVTLDGVLQGPGGPDEDRDGGFEHGGWLVPYFDETVGAFVTDVHVRADALLLGRRTYQIFAASWPNMPADGDPIAAKLNSMPKYVASRTLGAVEWHNSTLLDGDAAQAVADLKGKVDGEILVAGSGDLLQTLIRHDLVDVFHLIVFPVVLGTGKRLFADGTVPSGLRLTGTKASATGVVMSTYEPAGELKHGSFELGGDDEGGREARGL